MLGFNKMVRKNLEEHKRNKLMSVIAIVLSMAVLISVFQGLIINAISLSFEGATSDTTVGTGDELINLGDAANGYDFKNNITGMDIVTNEATSDDDIRKIRFDLSYSGLPSSEVNPDQQYIWFKLDENIQIPAPGLPGAGKTGQVVDGAAESGRYFITEDGYVIIKFHTTYLQDHSGSPIGGNISFEADVVRDETDVNDHVDITVNNQITVTVPGYTAKEFGISKDGFVVDGDNIKWTVSINNPAGANIGGYYVTDTMIGSADNTGVSIIPSSAATYDNSTGRVTIADGCTESKITITYTTPAQTSGITGESVRNTAKVFDKDNVNKGESSKDVFIQPSITLGKTGNADFTQNPPTAAWTVTVDNPKNVNLNGFTLEDTAIKADGDIQISGLTKDTDYIVEDGKITFIRDVTSASLNISYTTTLASDADYKNKATLKDPNGKYMETTAEVKKAVDLWKWSAVEGEYIKWGVEVEIAAGKTLTGGYIKDSLFGSTNFQTNNDGFKLYADKGDGNGYRITTDLTWDETNKRFNLPSPVSGPIKYKIEYFTHKMDEATTTDTANNQYITKNEAYIGEGDTILDSDTKEVKVTPTNSISKDVVSTNSTLNPDKNGGTVEIIWKVRLEQEKGIFKGKTFTDTLDGKLNFPGDASTTITGIYYNNNTGNTLDSSLYTAKILGTTPNSFTITFANDTAFDSINVIEINYKTVYNFTKDEMGEIVNLGNTANFNGKDAPKNVDVRIPDGKPPYRKSDESGENKDSTTHRVSELDVVLVDGVKYYVVPWKIIINENHAADYMDLRLEDTLPANFKLYTDEKIYIYVPDWDSSSTGGYDGRVELSPATSTEVWQPSYYYDETNNKVHFILFAQNTHRDSVAEINYKTIVPVDYLDSQVKANKQDGFSITNIVKGTTGMYQDEVTHTQIIQPSSFTKDLTNVDETTNTNKFPGYISYLVDINPDKLDLSKDDNLKFTDTFRVIGTDPGAITAGLHEIKFYKVNADGTRTELTAGKDVFYMTDTSKGATEIKSQLQIHYYNDKSNSKQYWYITYPTDEAEVEKLLNSTITFDLDLKVKDNQDINLSACFVTGIDTSNKPTFNEYGSSKLKIDGSASNSITLKNNGNGKYTVKVNIPDSLKDDWGQTTVGIGLLYNGSNVVDAQIPYPATTDCGEVVLTHNGTTYNCKVEFVRNDANGGQNNYWRIIAPDGKSFSDLTGATGTLSLSFAPNDSTNNSVTLSCIGQNSWDYISLFNNSNSTTITINETGSYAIPISLPGWMQSTNEIKIYANEAITLPGEVLVEEKNYYDNVGTASSLKVQNDNSMKLSFIVPDEEHIQVEYTLIGKTLSGKTDEEFKVNNELKIENGLVGETADKDANFVVSDSTLATSYTKEAITLTKVDMQNSGLLLDGSQFEIYRYDLTNKKWQVGASGNVTSLDVDIVFAEIGTTPYILEPQGNTMKYDILADITSNTEYNSYMFVLKEIKAPEGYELRTEPFVFLYGGPYAIYDLNNQLVEGTFLKKLNSANMTIEEILETIGTEIYKNELSTENYTLDNVSQIVNGGQLAIENQKKTEITVNKTWTGVEISQVEYVKFGLYSSTTPHTALPEGEKFPANLVLVGEKTARPTGDKITCTWDNLNSVNELYQEVYYYVKEISYKLTGETEVEIDSTTTSPGYVPTYGQNGVSAGEVIVGVTNVPNGTTPETGSLTVTKEWISTDGKTPLEWPTDVTVNFKLQTSDDGATWTDYGAAEYTLNSTTTSVTIEGLPLNKHYKVVETSTHEGYTVAYSADVVLDTANLTGTITITNTENAPDTGSIKVKKEWIMLNGTTPPTNITEIKFKLLYSSTQDGTYTPLTKATGEFVNVGNIGTDGTFTITSTGEWTTTISNLPINYFYKIEEVTVDGFEVTYKGNGVKASSDVTTAEPITVTNTEKSGSLTVKKNWVGTEQGITLPNVTFKLYQTTDSTLSPSNIGNLTPFGTYTIPTTTGTEWTYTIPNKLPLKDSTGADYYYFVVEDAITGYDISYSANNVNLSTATDNAGEVTITNKAGATMPETGGAGTLGFTLTGTAIITLAATGYLIMRRRKADK